MLFSSARLNPPKELIPTKEGIKRLLLRIYIRISITAICTDCRWNPMRKIVAPAGVQWIYFFSFFLYFRWRFGNMHRAVVSPAKPIKLLVCFLWLRRALNRSFTIFQYWKYWSIYCFKKIWTWNFAIFNVFKRNFFTFSMFCCNCLPSSSFHLSKSSTGVCCNAHNAQVAILLSCHLHIENSNR